MLLKLRLESSKDDRFNHFKNEVIKYFNRVDRPVLVGEISLYLKLSLEEAETLLTTLSLEDLPLIKKASKEELSKYDYELAYVLTSKAKAKLAFD